jgi:ubiquinone/menaquinone biosynthesis C-methylase UbiE
MDKKPVAAGKSSFDLIDPREFFARVDLHPGTRVLDLGCGVGRYSLEISKRLGGNGLVYAVDSWEEGIETLKQTIRESGIVNIRPIVADIAERLPLEDASVDFCLMGTVLHDLSAADQSAALTQVVRVLKPGGVLALVEFKKVDRGPGPPKPIRISEQEAEAMIGEFGFLKTYCGDLGEFTYVLTARKK